MSVYAMLFLLEAKERGKKISSDCSNRAIAI